MEISSQYIKISGAFEIPLDTKLIIGADYPISLTGSITAQSDKDEQDNTLSREYRFRPSTGQIKAKEGVVALKDKRSNSKRFRSMIQAYWHEEGDPEAYYDRVMNALMAHSEELKSCVDKWLVE